MKEYKLQGHQRTARVGTNRRKGFADSCSDVRPRTQKSRRAFNTASCTYRSSGKLVFPHPTDRPTNSVPFPALTYYPSTFCRATFFLFPGSQRRNTAADISLFMPTSDLLHRVVRWKLRFTQARVKNTSQLSYRSLYFRNNMVIILSQYVYNSTVVCRNNLFFLN